MKKIDDLINSKRGEILTDNMHEERGMILEFMKEFHEKYEIGTNFFESSDEKSLNSYVNLLREEWKAFKK
jgi:hypothetical protein